MSNSKVFKSAPFTPRHVFITKTIDKDLEKKKIRQGDTSYMPIPIAMKDVSSKLHDVAKELSYAVNFTARSAMNFLDDDFFVSINKKIHPETGAKIPSQGSERIKSVGGFDFSEFFSSDYKQRSRVERIARAELCSLIDSFADKFKEDKHASQGKKRTFSLTPPRMGMKINFGFVDKGFYRTYPMNKKNVIEIRFVVKDIIVSIIGSIPDTYNDADTTYSPAAVHFDKGGNALFFIPVAYPRLYTSVSSQYCLSADIGKKHPYVVSVIRMSDEEVVDTVYPSLRIYKIQKDINSSDQQIQNIKEKLSLIQHRERTYEKNRTLGRTTDKDYQQHLDDLEYEYIYTREIRRKRKSISRKKEELAKIIGQEIADISLTWDNAAIGIEDLSFVTNTTNNRRWNFGQIQKWIQHYANIQGLVCLAVSAWKSSHICSSCGSLHTVMRNKERLLHCLDCGAVVDRDVSASIVLAKRLAPKAQSSHKTRETKRRNYNIPPLSNTEEDGFVVRIPSRKESNAPKKNRDKSSPTPKRKRKRKKQEIDSYCRELFLDALTRKEVNSFVSPTQRDRGGVDTIVKLDSQQHTPRLVTVDTLAYCESIIGN